MPPNCNSMAHRCFRERSCCSGKTHAPTKVAGHRFHPLKRQFLCSRTDSTSVLLHRSGVLLRAVPAHPQASAQQRSGHYTQLEWDQHVGTLLNRLGVAADAQPAELWQHLSANCSTDHQQQQLQQHLDLQTYRLLLRAAAATCTTQEQYNQLQPLIQAATAVLPSFDLADFQLLLQLCAQARYIPDKEWLAAVVYADTGGFERLYKESAAADIVHLFADLSSVFASHRQLYVDTQQYTLLLQQQQQQPSNSSQQQTYSSSTAKSSKQLNPSTATEAAALQSALDTATANLLSIQQDQLLAGELSAVGGYWLVRRLLPQLAGGEHTTAALRGFGALPGLGYQVLDSAEADALLQLLALHLPTWNPNQLATALSSTLPCLGEQVPTDGQSLALLFAAVGAAAAAGMGPREAGRLLVVLSQLPGYAPDAKVAQALLDCSLQPPLAMSARQLYQLLSAASELGATPRPQQLQLIQRILQQ